MKALQLTDYTCFEYSDVPTPSPGPDEVLIRLKACSICGSDIHGCQGGSGRRIPPIIMGHEASGIIEKTGSLVKGFKDGDRVTFDSTEYCGHCDFCKKGLTNLCSNRRIVGVSCADYKKDGAMAEYITVKAHTLYRIPDSVSFEEACLTEPLSVGLHAVRLSKPEKGRKVVVIGDGTIGLMTLMSALAAGIEDAVLIGRHEHRLRIARQLPHVSVINSAHENPSEVLPDSMKDTGADIIYDAVGTSQTLAEAFSYVKNGGKIVCIGNASVQADFPLQECIVRQIQIIGSYSSAGEYESGLKLIADKKICLEPFTRCIYPLSRGAEAFQMLMEKKSDTVKVILTM